MTTIFEKVNFPSDWAIGTNSHCISSSNFFVTPVLICLSVFCFFALYGFVINNYAVHTVLQFSKQGVGQIISGNFMSSQAIGTNSYCNSLSNSFVTLVLICFSVLSLFFALYGFEINNYAVHTLLQSSKQGVGQIISGNFVSSQAIL